VILPSARPNWFTIASTWIHPGTDQSIQDFYCEACYHKFSVRRRTALNCLKTRAERVGKAPAALGEGLAVAVAGRVFGMAKDAITAWLYHAGMHRERLHHRRFQCLHLVHPQHDELRTTLRNKGQEVWLWLALDPQTKIISPTLQQLVLGEQ